MRINTKLTDVEIRWIKNVYKKGSFEKGGTQKEAFGEIQITKRINEGRKKAGIETVSRKAISNIIKKIETGCTIIPSNVQPVKKIICPECGHTFNIKR